MNWKQPIPIGLEEIFDKDFRCMGLYKQLIYKACNKDGFFTDSRGKTTPILRGQVIFGRRTFADELCWDDMTTRRALVKLVDNYKVCQIVSQQDNTNFTVISINNYDEIIDMSHQRASSEPAVSTSKSVKSVDNINNILDKSNNAKAGNEFVNKILEKFKERIGFNPTDKKPRFEAYNLTRKINKLLKDIGREETPEQTMKVIDKYFDWLDKQEWMDNVQNMSVIRRKFEIYQQQVINHINKNVQKT